MSYLVILYLMMALIAIDYFIELVLGYLNYKNVNKNVPEVLAGMYDEGGIVKSQAYQNDLYKFGLVSSFISFITMIIILYWGGFGKLDLWLRAFAPNELLLSLYFFGAIFFIADILSLPIQLYSTFVIEKKHGFNRSSVKTFVLDKIKGYLLTLIVGGILLSAFIYLVFAMGRDFWWLFWIVISLFSLLGSLVYASWILPIFNKLSPLQEGELRDAIVEYTSKVNFPVVNIMVLDGSKRSSKANAFFSGFGKQKKIMLYDTLIEKHTIDELVAIIAHEVGHYKKRHIWQGMAISILQTGTMLYLLSMMIFNTQLTWAMGGDTTAMHLNVLAFGILYTPLSNVLNILSNWFSRKNEYEADRFAVETFAAEPLVSALKSLSINHLSNLTPHPSYVFMHYSHPPLYQRLSAILK